MGKDLTLRTTQLNTTNWISEMKLIACIKCPNVSEKEGKSFCEFEACYSYLTKCIQNKALDYFLTNNIYDEGRNSKHARQLMVTVSQSFK